MKKNLFATLIVLAGSMFCYQLFAQNSIQLNYGYKKPVGNNISDAFNKAWSETITVMHQLHDSKTALGLTYTQQKFQSASDYFKDGYEAKMNISNALVSFRRKMFLKEEHHWYWGVDLGMAFQKLGTSKGNVSDSEKKTGFTKGVIVGSVWRLNQQFAIDANATYHVTVSDRIYYDDQFSSNKFKYAAINLGVRYEFK